MTSDRIKEIQQTTAYPDSRSVNQALLQVWNECEQEANLRLSDQQSKHEQEMKDFAEYVHKFGYVNCSRGWYNNVADLYANKMISTTELLTKFKNDHNNNN